MSNGLGGGKWDTTKPFEPVTMDSFMPGGAVYKAAMTGLLVNVTARQAIVSGGIQSWLAVSNLPLVDNALQYVILDLSSYSPGVFDTPTVSPTVPNNVNTVVLAQVQTNGGNVTFINQIQERVRNLAASGVSSVTVNAPLNITNPIDPANPNIEIPKAAGPATDGYMSAAEALKLAGIEAGADVTDPTNVAAAGALMSSLFTGATAELLIGTSTPGAPGVLPPGAVGSVLQRIAAPPFLQWAPTSGFVPQVLLVPCDARIGAGILPYNSYRFQKAFELKSGGIEVNAANNNLIDITVPGIYIFIAMILKQRGNFAGSMQWNSPPNPEVVRGRWQYNTGGGGKTISALVLGGFQGSGQLALRDDTNDGYNGAVQDNIVGVFKIAD